MYGIDRSHANEEERENRIVKLRKFLTVACAALCMTLLFALPAQAAGKVAPSGDRTGATDTQRIQAALDGGGNVVLSPGQYYINKRLYVNKNNTTITATGAKITQVDISKGILATKLNYKGWDGIQNLTINGGEWYKDVSAYKKGGETATTMQFIHMRNLTIRNATFTNCNEGHQVEMAGVDTALIENCVFGGKYVGVEQTNEAIQLDVVHSEETVGPGTIYDDTYCKNITIRNNRIEGKRGVGSHLAVKDHLITNVVVENNEITSEYEAVCFLMAKNVTVRNNILKHKAKESNKFLDIGIDIKTTKGEGEASVEVLAPQKNAMTPLSKVSKNNYNVQIYGNNISGFTDNGIRVLGAETKEKKGKRTIVKAVPIAQVSIHDNVITNVKENAIQVTTGTPASGAKAVSVKNNKIVNCNENGISIITSPKVTVAGNQITKAKERGIVLNNSKSCKVEKNKLINCGSYGVSALYSDSVNIKNNKVDASGKIPKSKETKKDIDKHGIVVNTCAKAKVTDNTVLKTRGSGISVQSAPNILIQKNKVTGSGNYGIIVNTNSTKAQILSNTVKDAKKRLIQLGDGSNSCTVKNNKLSGKCEFAFSLVNNKVKKCNIQIMEKLVVKNAKAKGKEISGTCGRSLKSLTVSVKGSKAVKAKITKKAFTAKLPTSLKKGSVVTLKQEDKGGNVYTTTYTVK